MGGTCSTHRCDEKPIQNWLENLKGKDHFGVVNIDRRIILKCTVGN
jgi:hypothetical protein